MSQAESNRTQSMTSSKAAELHALVAGFTLADLLAELEDADLDIIRDSLAEAERAHAGLIAAGRNDLADAAAWLEAQRKAALDTASCCIAAATAIVTRATDLSTAIARIIDAPSAR